MFHDKLQIICWKQTEITMTQNPDSTPSSTVVHRPTRKKMVAIYDRVAELAIAKRYSEIDRLIRIVSNRSCGVVKMSAWMATCRLEDLVDRSPLSDCESECQ